MDYVLQDSNSSKHKILRQGSFNSLQSNSKLSKINSFIRPGLKSKLSIIFKDNEITQQLQQQIHAIDKCISLYEPRLKHRQEYLQSLSMREQILALDEVINSKQNEIKMITQEVKHLKSISSNNNVALIKTNSKTYLKDDENNISSEQIVKNSQLSSQNNIFKLADQLKQQRELLIKLQYEHTSKKDKLNDITSKVQQIQEKYVERCAQTKQRPLRYEEFRELNQEKKKQMELKASKRAQKVSVRQQRPSLIRQIPQFVFNTEPIKTQRDVNATNANKKSLKGLQSRKLIAQQALKNARKKHNHELTQLMAKLEFLRDQDSLLEEKIREKEEEKIMLEAKFNQEKGGNLPSFHLHAHNRLISPVNNRSSREHKLSNNNILSAKLNRLMSPTTPHSNQKPSDRFHSPFSPHHRRLLSSRSGTQKVDRPQFGDRGFVRKFTYQEQNEKKVYEEEEGDRFDDYGEKTIYRKSKNSTSNKEPSTNENDSNFDRIN